MTFSKKLLALAIFAMASLSASAQISVGVKAGANASTTYGTAEEFDGEKIESVALGAGFQAGLVLNMDITEGLGLMAELNFEQKNGVKNVVDLTLPISADLALTTNADIKNSFSYVNLPILLKLGGEKLKFYVGPNFAYLIAAKSKITTTSVITSPLGTTDEVVEEEEIDFIKDFEDNDEGTFINSLDIGANLGVMFNLTDNLFLDFRINHGITDATNNDYDESLVPNGVDANGNTTHDKREDADRNVSLQLSVGYTF